LGQRGVASQVRSGGGGDVIAVAVTGGPAGGGLCARTPPRPPRCGAADVAPGCGNGPLRSRPSGPLSRQMRAAGAAGSSFGGWGRPGAGLTLSRVK